MGRFFIAVFGSVFLLGGVAEAHPLDLGYLTLTVSGNGSSLTIDSNFELNPKAAEGFTHSKEALSSKELVSRYEGQLFRSTLGAVTLLSDGAPCSWKAPHAEYINSQQIKITAQAQCNHPSTNRETQDLKVTLPFLAQAASTYQVLGKLTFLRAEHSFLLEPKNLSVTLKADPGQDHSFGSFVWMGIEHIGASPSEWKNAQGFHFPDGIDHILFLVALILTGGSFLQMVKTATGFTLGHSVTLALASLQVVHLPSRLVESAIALSIMYVAFEDLFRRAPKRRWQIATLFGLVHGFGFAAALGDLHLNHEKMLQALIGFNLGVETGQACIIAVLLPLVWLVRMRPKVSRIAIPSSALGIGITASYWFFQRAFG